MKFKIKTPELVAILSIVEKGVGNSKIMPITEYLHFQLEEGTLYVTATDLTNFITYTANDIEGEDGEVVIHASSIIKLAEKTTKEEMTFEVIDNHVQVKGNGTYKIGLLDEQYPDYEFSVTNSVEIDIDKLKKALTINEQSISKEMLTPVLSGYNVGGKLITTDGIKMCINDVDLLSGNEMLLTQSLSDLIMTLNGTVKVEKDDKKVMFTSEKITVFGNELEGLEDYPDITPLLDLEHEGKVTVDKKEIVNALDRLSIFADPFENNGVTLKFKDDVIELSDFKNNSQEKIPYKDETIKDFGDEVEISVNLQYLRELISVLDKSDVTMYFGNDKPLKIVENEVTEILSIMEVAEEDE